MPSRPLHFLLSACALCLLAACGSAQYTPVAGKTQPVDLDYYAPAVDTFLVLLDTSGSMTDDDTERLKIHTAQDLVASFNDAAPELGFNAGMVIFGKGAGSCIGDGVARTIYGMTTYNTADFLQALSSVECASSTTPIVDAFGLADEMLEDDSGHIALIVFSDFKWSDPEGVMDAVAGLKEQHGDRLCLHGVRIGDYDSGRGLIDEITDVEGCDTIVDAAAVTEPTAMTGYAADVLMAPVAYETHTLSAMALFDFDSAVLTEQGKGELATLGEYIRGKGIKVSDIDIIGHTCDIGTDAYNQGLSERRAQAVRDYLVSAGIDAGIIEAAGLGELDPIVPNSSDNNRRLNRRVEIHVGTSRPSGS